MVEIDTFIASRLTGKMHIPLLFANTLLFRLTELICTLLYILLKNLWVRPVWTLLSAEGLPSLLN